VLLMCFCELGCVVFVVGSFGYFGYVHFVDGRHPELRDKLRSFKRELAQGLKV
jgi:hypothetical protein